VGLKFRSRHQIFDCYRSAEWLVSVRKIVFSYFVVIGIAANNINETISRKRDRDREKERDIPISLSSLVLVSILDRPAGMQRLK
jgi:hypothetical protein